MSRLAERPQEADLREEAQALRRIEPHLLERVAGDAGVSVEARQRLVDPSRGLADERAKGACTIEGDVFDEARRFFVGQCCQFVGVAELGQRVARTEVEQLLVVFADERTVGRRPDQPARLRLELGGTERALLCGREQLVIGRAAGEKIGQAGRRFEAGQRHGVAFFDSIALPEQVDEVRVLQGDLDHRARTALEVSAELLARREDVVHLHAIFVGDGPAVRAFQKLRHELVATRGLALHRDVATLERRFACRRLGQHLCHVVNEAMQVLD